MAKAFLSSAPNWKWKDDLKGLRNPNSSGMTLNNTGRKGYCHSGKRKQSKKQWQKRKTSKFWVTMPVHNLWKYYFWQQVKRDFQSLQSFCTQSNLQGGGGDRHSHSHLLSSQRWVSPNFTPNVISSNWTKWDNLMINLAVIFDRARVALWVTKHRMQYNV